jgi:hypothetical protein
MPIIPLSHFTQRVYEATVRQGVECCCSVPQLPLTGTSWVVLPQFLVLACLPRILGRHDLLRIAVFA